MKSFPQILFTVCAVLSVASAAGLGSRAAATSSSMKTPVESKAQTKARLLEDAPWDSGTRVYNQFDNEGWWSGTISSFNSATGVYTVTWEDGSTDYYDDDDKIDQMVAYAQNDPQNNPAGAGSAAGTYPAGTPVSLFEEGEWYDGVVVQSGSGTYTIRWDEDDEIEQIQAGPYMDQMVQDAFGDDDAAPAGYDAPTPSSGSSGAVSVGTPVSYYEDGEWTDGTIIDYSNGVYAVAWEDGSQDQYDDSGDDYKELSQAALDAIGDDDAAPAADDSASSPSFSTGTYLSDWEDGEWVDGVVVDFQNGNYIVRWDDEDEVEYYNSANADDMQELTKMSQDSMGDDDAPPASFFESEDLWQIGTPVAWTEDDIVWYGKIDGFRQGEYSIAWDNGEFENLGDFDVVNQMVSNAALSPRGKSGMGAFGKAVFTLFIISVCAVGAIYGYKFYEKQQAENKRERELALEDGGNSSYRDQPLPKII